jgi:hypothetical protein
MKLGGVMSNWNYGPRIGQRGKYITKVFNDGAVTIYEEDNPGHKILLSKKDLQTLLDHQKGNKPWPMPK